MTAILNAFKFFFILEGLLPVWEILLQTMGSY